MRLYRNLQALRAVLALVVVYHHASIQLPPGYGLETGQYFHTSVTDLFFVISGFVAVLMIEKHQTASRFLLDRVARIMPLYWLVTLFIALIWIFHPSLLRSTIVTFSTLAASLLFIPHHNLSFPDQIWPVLIPGWSLNFIMFFYFLCMLWMVVGKGHTISGLLSTIGFLVAIGLVLHPKSAVALTYTSPHLLEFAFGLLLGSAVQDGWLERRSWLGVALPAGVLLILLCEFSHPTDLVREVGVFVAAPLSVLGAVALEQNDIIIHNRLVRLIGDSSYSIYLTHLFTLGLLRAFWIREIAPGTNSLLSTAFMAVALLTCTAVGALCRRLVEVPLNDLVRSLLRMDATAGKSLSPKTELGSAINLSARGAFPAFGDVGHRLARIARARFELVATLSFGVVAQWLKWLAWP